MMARPSYKIASKTGPIIVCVSRPTDSRGEIVYETQGETQKDQPVVAGVFVLPSPIKLPKPKYPKSSKKTHAAGNVRVEGVITQNGDFIDAKVADGDDPDFSQSALEAVARYRFKPATLDGKPVAVFVRVDINFQIRKW
jgi:TonB family protein